MSLRPARCDVAVLDATDEPAAQSDGPVGALPVQVDHGAQTDALIAVELAYNDGSMRMGPLLTDLDPASFDAIRAATQATLTTDTNAVSVALQPAVEAPAPTDWTGLDLSNQLARVGGSDPAFPAALDLVRRLEADSTYFRPPPHPFALQVRYIGKGVARCALLLLGATVSDTRGTKQRSVLDELIGRSRLLPGEISEGLINAARAHRAETLVRRAVSAAHVKEADTLAALVIESGPSARANIARGFVDELWSIDDQVSVLRALETTTWRSGAADEHRRLRAQRESLESRLGRKHPWP